MVAELIDGTWIIDAPWLADPVTGDTWHAAYWEAMRLRK